MEKTINWKVLLSVIGLIAIVVLLSAAPVFAATDLDESMLIDGFLKGLLDISTEIEQKFLVLAKQLFWLLATIQFAYAVITLGRRGDFSFNSIIDLLIREILYIGFFWMLLAWPTIPLSKRGLASFIVDGFRDAGELATGFRLITPSTVLGRGSELAWMVVKNSLGWNIGKTLVSVIPALIILVSFAFAAAHTAVMLIEFYIIAPVGVLMLGMGGSLWTKSYAESYLKCLVSIGVKLLCLQVVLAFCIKFLDKLIKDSAGTGTVPGSPGFIQGAFALAGISIVIYMAVQQLPGFASGLISGGSAGSASALTGAMGAIGGAIGGAVGAVAGVAGAGMAAAAAHKEASGGGGESGIGDAAQVSGSSSGGGGSGGGESGGGSSAAQNGGASSGSSSLPSALRESSPTGGGSSGASSASEASGSESRSSSGASSASQASGSESGGSSGASSASEASESDSSGSSSASSASEASESDSKGSSSASSDMSAANDGAGSGGKENGASAKALSQASSAAKNAPASKSSSHNAPSVSRSGFVAKAMIRRAMGMKPISGKMQSQLDKLEAYRNGGMSNQQMQMYKAMFSAMTDVMGAGGNGNTSGDNTMFPGAVEQGGNNK